MKRVLCALSCALMFAAVEAQAASSVTTGAGYKTMLEELCAAYRAQGGAVEEMYGGHIGQMLVQIEQGSGANIVISDRGTLEEAVSSVEFESQLELGRTLLVLAWRKGVNVTSPADLAGGSILSVALPDAKAAIYGRAAAAYLQSSGLAGRIEKKIIMLSSVPQVSSHLVSGEIDAGFINRVAAKNGAAKLGGSLEIAEGYPPLVMVAAVVKGAGQDPAVSKFLAFLQSERAREILKKNGIW